VALDGLKGVWGEYQRALEDYGGDVHFYCSAEDLGLLKSVRLFFYFN